MSAFTDPGREPASDSIIELDDIDAALDELDRHMKRQDREIARLRRLEPTPMMEVVRLLALALLASTGFVLMVTPGGFAFAIAVLVATVVMWALTP